LEAENGCRSFFIGSIEVANCNDKYNDRLEKEVSC
jgi:hypothetical protein